MLIIYVLASRVSVRKICIIDAHHQQRQKKIYKWKWWKWWKGAKEEEQNEKARRHIWICVHTIGKHTADWGYTKWKLTAKNKEKESIQSRKGGKADAKLSNETAAAALLYFKSVSANFCSFDFTVAYRCPLVVDVQCTHSLVTATHRRDKVVMAVEHTTVNKWTL